MAEARVIKFMYTGRSYQVPAYGGQITPKRGVVTVKWPIFSFNARNHITETIEATVAKFCMQVEYIKCLAFDDRLLLMGVDRVTVLGSKW